MAILLSRTGVLAVGVVELLTRLGTHLVMVVEGEAVVLVRAALRRQGDHRLMAVLAAVAGQEIRHQIKMEEMVAADPARREEVALEGLRHHPLSRLLNQLSVSEAEEAIIATRLPQDVQQGRMAGLHLEAEEGEPGKMMNSHLARVEMVATVTQSSREGCNNESAHR